MLRSDNTGAALVAPVSLQEERTMKILIMRDTVCGGVPVYAGQVVEATERDGRICVMANKARIWNTEADVLAAPKIKTRKAKANESTD